MNATLSTRKAEILLIEDSPSDIQLIKECFKESSFNHNLHVATDGAEGIDFLKKAGKYEGNAVNPDFVILDLNLPKMNGREVLASIKSDEKLKRTPVMIFSSSNNENDIFETYGNHANCYLVKPINLDEFMETIKSIEVLDSNGKFTIINRLR